MTMMPRVDEYALVAEKSTDEFTTECAAAMANGFVLYGNPFSWGEFLCQTFVKLAYVPERIQDDANVIFTEAGR